jgi:chitodextrinase
MLRMKTLLLFLLLALAFAACGGAGAPESASTGSGSSTTSADKIAPSIPGSFTAAAAGSTGANLSWSASSDNVGVTGYIVLRNGAQVATPTTKSYADTSLSAGQTYVYAVAARDAAGNTSPNSPSQSVTTAGAPPADTIPPSVPSNLAATPGSNAISLTWGASTDNVGVTGYIVRRNGTPVATIAATSYVDTGLIASTSYSFTVSAVDAVANASAQTAAVTATTLASGTSTSLTQLSASLQPGQWANFNMGGLTSSLVGASTQASPSILFYAGRGHWDPVHKKLQYAGTSHTGGAFVDGAGGLITWDDATNQWTRETYTWSSEDPGHAYYHVALNKGNGDLYFRKFNSPSIYRRAYGSTGQASWQSGPVANHLNLANQVAGGLEWFPGLNGGAGGLVFVDEVGATWTNAALSSWTGQSGSSLSGPYQNWIVHAGGFVYWGGGNGSMAMYRLSSTGSVTAMPSTPLEAGANTSNSAIVLPHPNGTDLLLFGTASGGAIHRFNGTSWTSVGTHQIGAQLWVGFTVPEYGVIVFLRHAGDGTGAASAIVYKP